MPLKTVLDSETFGELDESTRELYKESDEGYVLDVEGIDDHPTVKGLRSGHQRSKEERKKAQEQADKLKRRFGPLVDVDDLDLSTVDPDKVTEFLPYLTGEAELPTGDNKDLTAEQRQKIKENEQKKWEPKVQEVGQERDQWKGIAENSLINGELRAALHGAGVKNEKFLNLLVEHYAKRGRVDVDDGKVTTLIDSEYGETSIKEFVKEWASTEDAKSFIEAERNSGGGSRGGAGDGKIKNPWSKEHWNQMEQARIYQEDPERAGRMAAEHGKRVGAR